jgi:hypothetical protein
MHVCCPAHVPIAQMAVRNLTMHFIRARGAALNSRPPPKFGEFRDDDSRPVLAAGGSGVDARGLSGPVPQYVNDVDEINAAVDAIQSKRTSYVFLVTFSCLACV